MSTCRTRFPAIVALCTILLLTQACTGYRQSRHTNHATAKGESMTVPIQVHETRLANGLKLLCVEDRSAPVFTIVFVAPCGGRTEATKVAGISHYLEHAYSMGSSKLQPREMDKIVASRGGSKNAATSDDYTMYYENMPIEHFDLMLELEADRLATNQFPDQRFKSELSVVLEEKRMRYDNNPRSRLWSGLRELAFTSHPYRIMTIGTDDSIHAITPEATRDYYRQHYTTDNVTFILVGDFDAADAAKRFEHFFGAIPHGSKPDLDIAAEPEQKEERRLSESTDIPFPIVQIGFRTPPYRHPDAIALDILETVLDSGLSARLPSHLEKKQRIASGTYGYHQGSVDGQHFVIGGTCAPGISPQTLEQALWDEVNALAEHGITASELATARNRIEADLLRQLESTHGTARTLAYWDILTPGSHKDLLSYPARLQTLTPADIQRVAQKYFQHRTANVVTLLPENWTQPAATAVASDLSYTSTKEGDVTRCIFSNGLTLLHHRTDKLPSITVQASIRAGAGNVEATQAGLAALTATLLTTGTSSRSENELAKEIDAMGSSLSAGAAYYTSTLGATTLSRNFEATFACFADVLQHASLEDRPFEREQQHMLTVLKQQKTRASDLARKQFKQVLFPSHPLGQPQEGTTDSLQSLTAEQLREFYHNYYSPDRCTLIMVGDIELSQAIAAIQNQLGDWAPGQHASKNASIPEQGGDASVTLINKPGQSQANVFLGHLTVPRSHPDYPAITLMNFILGGGGLSSRIPSLVRTKMGLAYSVYTRFSHLQDTGYFYSGFQTKNESVKEAMDAILSEIDRIRTEAVSEEELNTAKGRYLGSLPFTTQTNQNKADLYSLAEVYGLPLNYPELRAEAMSALTVKDLKRAAEKYLHPDRLRIVVVSDKQAVESQLANYGPVQVLEIEK